MKWHLVYSQYLIATTLFSIIATKYCLVYCGKKYVYFICVIDRISYTIFFLGTIDNSEFCNFSSIFLHVAKFVPGYSAGSNLAESSPRQAIKFRKESPLRFCGNSRPNRTTELFVLPDNYKSHLITFPRFCFAAIFIGPAIAPALIRDRFNHILTVPRSVRDYHVHVRGATSYARNSIYIPLAECDATSRVLRRKYSDL